MGWVRQDFLERIEQREATFPTGLQLETFGAAIPHTDAECILTEFVAVVTNKQPVTFTSMEDINQSPCRYRVHLGVESTSCATRDAAIINEIITR